MSTLVLLVALSGLAGSLIPGPAMELIFWRPETFAGAEVIDDFHRRVLLTMDEYLGIPYHYAGRGPGGCPTGEHPSCCDCSGLVVSAYASVGVKIPHSSVGLLQVGEPVVREDLRPGDILIFRSDGSSTGQVNHSGIYVGNGLFIHAGSRGVRLDDLQGPYWGDSQRPRLRAIRRIPDPERTPSPGFEVPPTGLALDGKTSQDENRR